MRAQNKKLLEQRLEAEKAIKSQNQRMSQLHEQILKAQTEKKDRELTKTTLENKTTNMQTTKEEEKQTIDSLHKEIAEIKREYKKFNEEYKSTDEQITNVKGNIIDQRKQDTENKRALNKANKDLDQKMQYNKDHREQKATLEEDVRRSDLEWNKLIKQREVMAKKAAQAKQKCDDLTRQRDTMQEEYKRNCAEQAKKARMVEELKKEIESKMRERKLLGKDVVDKQEQERLKKDEL